VSGFGYDVLDVLRDPECDDYWPPFGFDVVDWLDDRKHKIATICPCCGEAWLSGPDALAAGKCWGCRA
jgi:hypothetical protein